MNTLNDKLDALEVTKNLIKQSIIDKGVPVTIQDSFRSYADKIKEISGGSVPIGNEAPRVVMKDIYNGSTFCDQIKTIDWTNFNALKPTSMINFFANWNGSTVYLNGLDTSTVTNMSGFFSGSKITGVNLEGLNLSNVTNISYMFSSCSDLEYIQSNGIDFNSVTNCSSMFAYNGLDIIQLEGIKNFHPVNMSYMFNDCKKLELVNLSSLDTSNCTDVTYMFSGCNKLAYVTWGNNWMSNPAIMDFDLSSCGELDYHSTLDLFNKLATRTNNPTLRIKSRPYNTLTQEEKEIASNKGWTVAVTA